MRVTVEGFRAGGGDRGEKRHADRPQETLRDHATVLMPRFSQALDRIPIDRPHRRHVLPTSFYFDLGSPYAYLTAERISGVFTEAGLDQPEWKPILLGGLFQRFDRDSWANGPGRDEGLADVERRASEYGLPPLVWPDPFPGNTLFAMRVATFAKQTGRTVSFALAGFRQAFAAGRDLSDPENVLIAAAACELHPARGREGRRDRRGQGGAARGDRRGRRAGRVRRPLARRRRRGVLGRRQTRRGGRGRKLRSGRGQVA